jgi:hypothetical protein
MSFTIFGLLSSALLPEIGDFYAIWRCPKVAIFGITMSSVPLTVFLAGVGIEKAG